MYSIDLETEIVRKKILYIFETKRTKQAYAIAERYANEALREFIQDQKNADGKGRFWTNRTYRAAREFYTEAFMRGKSIGFSMTNAVPYGEFLETFKGGKFSAIVPLKSKFYPLFLADIRKLYGKDI